MKKRGFTLIELLAVIVILAIIALIATPIILNMINDARKSAAVDSAYGYIEAIDYNNSIAQLNNKYNKIASGDVITINNDVKVKGTKPTSGTIEVDASGRVIEADLCIDGFNIVYQNEKAKATDSDKCGKKQNEEIVVKETTISDKAKTLVYTEDGKCKIDADSTDKSTYKYMGGCYIKGTSTNNYIWYNGFMWRIMGINEDGTVRLITDKSVTSIPFGSGTGKEYISDEGYIHDWLNDYFYANLNDTKEIISNGKYFCSDATMNSLNSTTARQTCTSGKEVEAYIGILSNDEYLLSDNSSTYLNNGEAIWTMTPANSTYAWYISSTKSEMVYTSTTYGIRPIINVKENSVITSGEKGDSTDYYVLKENKTKDITGTLNSIATSGEYVNLKGKTYRVVSEDNNGVKLIYDGYIGKTIYGEDNTFTTISGIGLKLNSETDSTSAISILGLVGSEDIVETTWYQGDAVTLPFKYNDILSSNTNGTKAKVGLIKVGEILAAQSSTIDTNEMYWTLNKYSYFNSAWYINSLGNAKNNSVSMEYAIRPVILVKKDIAVTGGTGTWDNPYQI